MASPFHDDRVFEYPSAEMTPAEFERFVVASFEQTRPLVDDLLVQHLETIEGIDGEFVFDATVRYSLAGMSFLVVVEAKRHAHPIKRDVLQVLESKARSVGAHKAVLVSTASLQRGAVEFAKVHGIALVQAAQGRFIYEVRDLMGAAPSEQDLFELDVPRFVRHCYSAADEPGYTEITLITKEPAHAAKLLLGLP